MKRVEFHPLAQDEVTAAEAWYRERSEVAAQAFVLEINHAIEEISEAPERWPVGRRGERRMVFRRFPYSLLYRIRKDNVFITAVAHQSRRPGYWRHRK
jgi:plasmid stabilization system protein ParE